MNNLRSTLHGLFFCTCLLLAMPSIADTSNEPHHNAGTITFTFDNNSGSCHVSDSEKKFEISHYVGGPQPRPCEEDRISFIRLDGVRSAATIRLWSYLRSGNPVGCQFDETYNFTLFFRTLKDTTTTQNIRLDELFNASEGTILQPGIKLIKKDITNKDKINKKLSCVEIIYD